jgi:RNA polymerase sigma-70 factor (ECF subfamily)
LRRHTEPRDFPVDLGNFFATCGGFFRRRLDSVERAERLTQETFHVVIRGTSRYEPRALVRTYFYSVALRLLATERRKQARAGVTAPSGLEPLLQQSPDTALSVKQALGKLELAEREVLMRREYEPLSYSEIADLLRIPVNTVRSRLFGSRLALRDCLEPRPKEA